MEPDSAILARRLSLSFAIAVIILSSLTITGHLMGIPQLRGEILGSPPTQPMTAAVFLTLGSTIILLSKRIRTPALYIATFLLVFYTLTVTGYLQTSITGYGSNSRFISSILFIIYAIILILFSSSRYTAPQVLAFSAGTVAYCVVTGYLGGVGVYSQYFQMAFYTAILHLLTSASFLSLYPEEGIVAPIHRSFTGGHLARLLIPIMIASITLLGLFTMKISQRLFPGFGEVFLMGMTASLTIIVVILASDELNRIDEKRSEYQRDLLEAQKFFKDVVENLAEAVAVFDHEGSIIYRNSAMKKLGIMDLPRPSSSGEPVMIERMKVGDGHYTGWMVPRFSDGKFTGYIVSLTDITDLIGIQRSLESTVGERDALLAEVHHRVKNNLQIIMSLLNIQAMNASEEAREVLRDAQSRVRAMAILHETIYDSGNFTGVDMGSFITRLIERLVSAYGVYGIHFQVDADVRVNLETAIPLGLLINEAVTNSIRHAFPSGEGSITVTMESDGLLYLRVEDDGTGMEGVPDGTVGLSLMRALADQLEGELEIESDHGTAVSLRFRELEYMKRT